MDSEQEIASYLIGNSLFVSACGLGASIAYSYDLPRTFYVKHNYFYAQDWYDEMSEKYPAAHLDQKQFLQAKRGIFNNNVTWENTFNQIYAPIVDLQRINEIYKKKARNIKISEEDEIILCVCEFFLLCQAAHIEHNDSVCSLVASGIIFPTVEIARAIYTDKPITFWISSLDQCIALLVGFIVYTGYLRHQVAQADKFACDQACDIDVLRGGLRFFNYITSHNLGMFDFTHPNSQTRAQAVFDEIERRLLNENNH